MDVELAQGHKLKCPQGPGKVRVKKTGWEEKACGLLVNLDFSFLVYTGGKQLSCCLISE